MKRAIVMNEVKKKDVRRSVGSTKCTFTVTVNFTQNATWQGHIHWAEKNQKQTFRSALEMLKLMDNALVEVSEETRPARWGEGA